MASLGVFFALTKNEVRELESRNEGNRLDYVKDVIEELFFETRREDLCETDKAWDAIHRCLTDGQLDGASADPLAIVVLGGRSMYAGDDYLMTLKGSAEVREAAPLLCRVTKSSLRAAYDHMDTSDYDGQVGDDDFDCTWTNFVELQGFWKRAAEKGLSVLFTADQ